MRVLNNPWVTASLALVAVAVVIYQLSPRAPDTKGLQQQPAPTLAHVAAPEPVPEKTKGSVFAPPPKILAAAQSTIDGTYVQSHFNEWIESPQRDPFLFMGPGVPEKGVVSPVSRWRLRGIYRQTGSEALAIINNGVYKVGDVIDGYRIERIDADAVWFVGPAGRERLGFPRPNPYVK